MHRRCFFGFLMLFLLMILVGSGHSQQSAESVGLIRGTITDLANKPIAEASIHYSGPQGFEGDVTSDESGSYLIPDLMPGRYTLNVTAEGYTPRQNLITAVMEGRESVFNVPLRAKPNLVGQLTQNRIALVAFGFVLGLVVGVLVAFMIRGKSA